MTFRRTDSGIAKNQRHCLFNKPLPSTSKPSLPITDNHSANKKPLSHFLPYDPMEITNEKLKVGLNEYLLLLEIAEQAMLALKQGELTSFDPLVGENACQIRAVKIALIVGQQAIDPEKLLRKIRAAKEIVENYLKSCPNFSENEMSLRWFLDNEEIDIKFTEDECYLIKSFVLTKTKVVLPFFKEDKPLVENAYTDEKKLIDIGQVSVRFCIKLVKNMRKELSSKSVNYVRQLAIKSNPSDIDHKKIFSDSFIYTHKGLKCLPYYWMTRILMKHALESGIPLLMLAQQFAKDKNYELVKTTKILFQPTPDGYKRACISSFDHERPVIVLIGTTCRNSNQLPNIDGWTTELTQRCIIEHVLAHAAAHRQYPDQSVDQLLTAIDDENYDYHKMKAAEWGCSLKNPSGFFLTHAFCDTIKNVNERFNSHATIS